MNTVYNVQKSTIICKFQRNFTATLELTCQSYHVCCKTGTLYSINVSVY